ncbi:MAG: hypothetical protein ACE5Q6_20180 [Dehalococcoidia bacterium]
MKWISEVLFLFFGPGETWAELARGFGLIAVIIGMLFLVHRWLSRDLQRRQK